MDAKKTTIKKLYGELVKMRGGVNEARLGVIGMAVCALDSGVLVKARLEQCTDEHSGVRYGKALCRVGRCVKVGSGGCNRGQIGYQIWLVWA